MMNINYDIFISIGTGQRVAASIPKLLISALLSPSLGHQTYSQWEFQDPKMELLYHFSGHILWGYSLT